VLDLYVKVRKHVHLVLSCIFYHKISFAIFASPPHDIAQDMRPTIVERFPTLGANRHPRFIQPQCGISWSMVSHTKKTGRHCAHISIYETYQQRKMLEVTESHSKTFYLFDLQ